MMIPPCYQCKERHITYDTDGKAHGCHKTCTRYLEYRQNLDKRRDAEFFDREAARTQSRYKAIMKGKYGWNRTKK